MSDSNLSSYQIEQIVVHRSNHDLLWDEEELNTELTGFKPNSANLEYRANVIDRKNIQTHLAVSLMARAPLYDNESRNFIKFVDGFNLSFCVLGIVRFPIRQDKEQIEKFIRTKNFDLLFPYARQHILDLSGQLGLSMGNLPFTESSEAIAGIESNGRKLGIIYYNADGTEETP